MLDFKKDRLDYGAMLIPPSGYHLAKAVAATYTLDLNTLLSIPVALFFSQTMEGSFEHEKVQLLDAIQRCPDVLRIYHQRGKIHVPQKHNRLYGFWSMRDRNLARQRLHRLSPQGLGAAIRT